MVEQKMEDIVSGVLDSDTQKNMLEFFTYLIESEMSLERGKGYWEHKLYWIVKYMNESVCYILINSSDEKDEPWIIWTDDSDSNWFSDFPLENHVKEMAWKNVDFCGNCGGCDNVGGSFKMIFGKAFKNVCRTTMKFINPNVEVLKCVKQMIDIRKNDILKNN